MLLILSFFLWCYSTVVLASNRTTDSGEPSSPFSFTKAIEVSADSCGQSNIEDIVDSKALSEIILWRVGTLAIKDKEMSCKVSQCPSQIRR